MHTHVVIARELVEAVDRLVGGRKRREFVADAIREKLEREQLGRALERTAGFLAPGSHPEWETPEQVSAWVRNLRATDERASERVPAPDEKV